MRRLLVRIGQGGARDDVEPAWMTVDERHRWLDMADDRRRAFVASRRLLRDALAQATGLSAAGWQVSAEAGVAPTASRAGLAHPTAPRVSLAHRLGWVTASVGAAGGGPIGVDLECDRPARGDPAGRAALALPADEFEHWRALDAGLREPALLRAWIAREAWFKAAGSGATWDFRRLACTPCEAARANVRIWEAGAVRVALCAHDAAALASAVCEGWLEGAAVQESCWHVGVPAARAR